MRRAPTWLLEASTIAAARVVVATGAAPAGAAPREHLRRVQTPQAFRFFAIRDAHATWSGEADAGDDEEWIGYDGINYGVWYDDVQFARTAVLHMKAAANLGVNRVVLGECGHAHKALTVIADKVLTGELNIPRESSMTVLLDIVKSGKIEFDKSRNDFPVTLHDPCNLVRLMGVVSPQREIIDAVVPEGRFREMAPHGVENYCCGGGSGFAIMSGHNFQDWRHHMTGRRKFRQILEAFQGEALERELKLLRTPQGEPSVGLQRYLIGDQLE